MKRYENGHTAVRERDREQARALWEDIFTEDSASFLDYYDEWKARENWIQTRYRGEQLISMVQWNPYEVQVRDHVWPSRYLIAVATRPEYRHQGYMAGLLREGLERFYQEQVPFVFLMPAAKEIYYPFNFRYIYDKAEGEVALPEQQEAPESELCVRPLRQDEYDLAAAFLQKRLAADHEMFVRRTPEYLMQIQAECASEGGALEGIFEKDQLIGVFSWWGEDKVEIRELVASSFWEREAKREMLLAALRTRFAGRRSLSVITTGWMGEKKPIIMARIVNLAAFVSIFSCPQSTEIILKVSDPLLPDNDGLFCWKLGPEGSALTRIAGKEPEAQFDIAGMVSWLMGYEEPEKLEKCSMTKEGKRKVSEIRVLDGTFFNEIV